MQVVCRKTSQVPLSRHHAAFAAVPAMRNWFFRHPSALDSTNDLLISIWRTACIVGGMLRITLRTAANSTVFTLQGALTGLWAKELLRVARANERGCGITFDIQRLSHIDAAGKEALRTLNKRGGSFITDSVFGRDLCDRLKLCRVACSPMQIEQGNECSIAKPD
jgi:hypothetical protein